MDNKFQKNRRAGMINKKLLKSKMILKGVTQPTISNILVLSITSVNQKINGNTIFKPEEIKKIQELLSLTNDETVAIFLS